MDLYFPWTYDASRKMVIDRRGKGVVLVSVAVGNPTMTPEEVSAVIDAVGALAAASGDLQAAAAEMIAAIEAQDYDDIGALIVEPELTGLRAALAKTRPREHGRPRRSWLGDAHYAREEFKEMTERAYTLKDIDRMRRCIGAINWKEAGGQFFDASDAALHRHAMVIEERLRTYMAGNVDPAEIYARYEELFGVTAEANFG